MTSNMKILTFLKNHISIKEKIKILFPGNWYQVSRFLSFKEKIFVLAVILIVTAAVLFWAGSVYFHFTKAVPKKGGSYTEGIVGQPMYINPLLSQTSQADSDLSQLIYSGLLKYDGQGKLANNLAESYEISEDRKTYTFYLKKNIKWHDGEPLTAGDIFFTFNAVQDPAYRSPLRLNWQGVEAEQKDDYTISFTLTNPYFGFLNNLTMGILPKHIWENVGPEKFILSELNLRPVGSGPYKFADFQKDSGGNIVSYELRAFPDYFEGEPFISKLKFNFYPDYDALAEAYNKKEIDGMGNAPADKLGDIKSKKGTEIYELNSPRSFAAFFNQSKSAALASQKVREALAYGTDRSQIISEVLYEKGTAIFSPFLSSMEGYENDIARYETNIEKAKSLLDEERWKLGEGQEIREKNGAKLQFEISTLDSPELAQTADVLSRQWKKIGADVQINILSVSDLQQNYIKPREYSALLFGQELSFNPDLYFFWHSSQTRDPGLNFALFNDKKADELLEKARGETDEEKRSEYYREFQKIITAKIPAVFLYSPKYLYPVSKKVKDIEAENINSPSGRFAEVNKWYVKTKRVKK